MSWYEQYKRLNDELKRQNYYQFKIEEVDDNRIITSTRQKIGLIEAIGNLDNRQYCFSNFSKLKPLIDKWESGKLY